MLATTPWRYRRVPAERPDHRYQRASCDILTTRRQIPAGSSRSLKFDTNCATRQTRQRASKAAPRDGPRIGAMDVMDINLVDPHQAQGMVN
jgi:hypothetical protein